MEIEYDDSNSDMYRQHTDKPKVKRRRKSSEHARLVWMVGGKEHRVLDQGSWALMQKKKKEFKDLYTVGILEVKS